jgi:hypothetical protein
MRRKLRSFSRIESEAIQAGGGEPLVQPQDHRGGVGLLVDLLEHVVLVAAELEILRGDADLDGLRAGRASCRGRRSGIRSSSRSPARRR